MIVVVGSVNVDTIVEVERLPMIGETVPSVRVHTAHGGKGANQAVAARRGGSGVQFVGCVGDDGIGRELVNELASEGIDVSLIQRSNHPSGGALITVDSEGQNTIVVDPGANADAVLGPLAIEAISSANVVLCQLEIPVGLVASAAEAATGTFILNAAPVVPLPDNLSDRIDILIVNETEMAELAGDAAPDTARGLGIKTVITTMGERGARIDTQSGSEYVAAPLVAVRDTTGAGDAFCGAFAAALDQGHGVGDSTIRGVTAGSEATLSSGARSPRESR